MRGEAAAPDTADAAGAAIAEVIAVSKRFGRSQALTNVSVAVPTGDSRALVGRNGAGKSTLVAVLTGMLAPDSGRVRFGGADAPGLAERQKWRDRVACVYQKSTLVPTLTVAENLLLNSQPTGPLGLIRWGAVRREAERVLAGWGMELDVEQECARLTVEQRQIVEIARALIQGARFIILDEPTAELEGREVRRLFDRIAHLQRTGVTFLYISHYLEEIYEVCRSVTVLRDGRVVAEGPLAAMPKERVVAAMVGEAGRASLAPGRVASASIAAKPALELRGVTIAGTAADISLRVGAGECVGLAGLAGSGKGEIGDAITGLIAPDAGGIAVAGTELRRSDVRDAQRKGVGTVPRDRHARGIVPLLPIAENMTMTIADRLGPAGVIVPARQQDAAMRMVRSLQIVATSVAQPIKELSGGNQQKAVMARALASEPQVLVLHYPTQGVDIASKEALFGIVERARAGGTAVLIISDELDELAVCDRVLVIFKGRLTREFTAGWDSEALVAAIEGIGHDERTG
ncbi:MAG TPA: sugar ABC transporter ATP-binding protein [Acetobacteraceae bacterium]|nr:sugar ABC transporter ATP-binding protein [Acetobacteraceae bacterium]